jgi:hypothetical protein
MKASLELEALNPILLTTEVERSGGRPVDGYA